MDKDEAMDRQGGDRVDVKQLFFQLNLFVCFYGLEKSISKTGMAIKMSLWRALLHDC